MNANRLWLPLATLALLASCAAPRRPVPPPAPTPPRPVASSTPIAPPRDWRDAPITPGTWSYRGEAQGTAAWFFAATGEPLFAVRCERMAPRVTLQRSGAANGPLPLSVVTTTLSRSFTVIPPPPGGPQQLAVSVSPRDPLLDAMAFSRGRFMVEAPGTATLYLPAWPEIARVVEDCRR